MASKRPSSSLSSDSAETVVQIDDLLTLILLCLPARSLIRFQSVSRHWRSLISNERFSYLHSVRRHRLHPPSFILRASYPVFYFFNYVDRIFQNYDLGFPYAKILHSCNGLLLLECRNTPFGMKNYFVLNPTNKNIRNLNFDGHKREMIVGLFLAFDPVKSLDYKVVCVKGKEDSQTEYVIQVLDSKNHEWASLGDPFSALPNTQFGNGIYSNNGIYWIKPRARSCLLHLDNGTVSDLPTIRFPRVRKGVSHRNFVFDSNGRIHCVSLYLQPKIKSVLVFELLEDHSCWVQKFRADLSPISAVFPELDGAELQVLAIVRGEEEEDCDVLLHFHHKVVKYRFRDGEFGVVFDMHFMQGYDREFMLQFDRNHVFPLIETLSPV